MFACVSFNFVIRKQTSFFDFSSHMRRSQGISGFRAARIFPFNPIKFSEEDFTPAEEFQELALKDEPAEGEKRLDLSASQAPTTSATTCEPTPSTSARIPEATPSVSATTPCAKVSDVPPTPKKVLKPITKKRKALMEKKAKREKRCETEPEKVDRNVNTSDKRPKERNQRKRKRNEEPVKNDPDLPVE
ncbi:hypothetical protein Trydic_g21085 [Trypoxylus dichotomus]